MNDKGLGEQHILVKITDSCFNFFLPITQVISMDHVTFQEEFI